MPEDQNRHIVFSLRGVGKVYLMGDVRVDALRAVDLDLMASEFIVLLGASGSGKSTFVNLILREVYITHTAHDNYEQHK